MIAPRAKPMHLFALAGILLLALGVRFAVARHYENRLPPEKKFEFGDSETYWELGEKLYRREPYAYGPREYRVMRTPGYPVLLAGLLFCSSGKATPWDARLLSVALGVVGVLSTYALARCWFSSFTALVSTFIAALAPCAVASSVFALAEAPFIPVMLLQLLCWWGVMKSDSPRHRLALAVAAGALAGVGVLIRPSWLLFTPLLLAISLVLRRKEPSFRATQLAPAVTCLLFLCVVLAPWWVRNYQVSGRFIATSLQAGPSLYDGLWPGADGSSDMRFVKIFEAHADKKLHVPDKGIEREIYLDQKMSQEAKAWAWSHPGRVAQLALIKFLRTWNFLPNFDEMQSWPLQLALVLGYIPVMITAGLGAWKFRAQRNLLLICLLPAIYFSLLHMVYVGSLRYRQPAMFSLFVLSAAWIGSFLERFFSSASAPPPLHRKGAAA